MFEINAMIFVTIIMGVIHISLWQIFPEKLRHMMFANPVLAFIMDLAGSGLITMFTGVASFVGMANLGGSVIFGIYAFWYIHHHGIKGIGIDWFKLFNFIPIWPNLVVCYEKDGVSWRK